MRNDLEEVTISNINGLYGAAATADDAINMAVQVQIKLFTVVQQWTCSGWDFPQDFAVIPPHSNQRPDTRIRPAYKW